MPITATRMRIVNAVGEKNHKDHECFLRAENAMSGKKGKKGESAFKGPKTGGTVRRFKESVKPEIRPIAGAKGVAELKVDKVVKDSQAVVDFDNRYKPYVFYLLMKHHGFVATRDVGSDGEPVYRNGPLEMECIYHDVLAKLMLGAIDGFDMDQERVGKGAFRSYIKKITASVVSDALAPDLIPVYKPDGTPEYTGQVVKDIKGRPKRDENGNVIYKQRKEFRKSFEVRNIQNAIAQVGLGGALGSRSTAEWTSSDIVNLRLFFAKCAYLWMTDAKIKSGKEGWVLKAMLDIFENGMDEDVVREELQKRNVIRKAGSFYVAKTRFLNDWKEAQTEFERHVLKMISLKGKCSKGTSGKTDPLRKGVYLWHPIVDRQAASQIVRKLEKKVQERVGVARIKYINENFSRIMATLVADADKKMAVKNAKRFAEVEKELRAEAALKAEKK